MHNHPVSNGICQHTLNTISSLIANEVTKTPIAKDSAIALALKKELLDGHIFHSSPGLQEMLWNKALEGILDKFEVLSLPNVQNMISLFRSSGKEGGVINSIINMIRHSTIEYIHGNVILGQEKEKVYLFKMLENRPRSGVHLLKRMQLG
jgi:hypothetical protein